MKSKRSSLPFLSEMEEALLKRYGLEKLLKDKDFLLYILNLIEAFQDRYKTPITLSVATDLISTAIKFEPKVSEVMILEDREDIRERIINVFSLAIIEQLTNMDYLSTQPTEEAKLAEARIELNKNVFIIHGKDLNLVEEISTLLREFGLNPVVLHEQPSEARTIVEKLEKYSNVGYAIVILGCDEVSPSATKCRASQNVLVEFGYFLGLLGRDRVLCLLQERVEPPSDLRGIVYLPFKESVREARDKIIKELKEAGYEIKI